jgi:hypothetical protein
VGALQGESGSRVVLGIKAVGRKRQGGMALQAVGKGLGALAELSSVGIRMTTLTAMRRTAREAVSKVGLGRVVALGTLQVGVGRFQGKPAGRVQQIGQLRRLLDKGRIALLVA